MGDSETKVDQRFTRRDYLTYEAIIATGSSIDEASEAVASTVIGHPEWDLEEAMTWGEWQSRRARNP